MIKVGGNFVKKELIKYLIADGNYTIVVENKTIIGSKCLSFYFDKLDHNFVRISRSVVINKNKIESMNSKFICIDGKSLSISRRCWKSIKYMFVTFFIMMLTSGYSQSIDTNIVKICENGAFYKLGDTLYHHNSINGQLSKVALNDLNNVGSTSTIKLTNNNGYITADITSIPLDLLPNLSNYITTEVDGDVSNELQTMSIDSTGLLKLSKNGGQINVFDGSQLPYVFIQNNEYLSTIQDPIYLGVGELINNNLTVQIQHEGKVELQTSLKLNDTTGIIITANNNATSGSYGNIIFGADTLFLATKYFAALQKIDTTSLSNRINNVNTDLATHRANDLDTLLNNELITSVSKIDRDVTITEAGINYTFKDSVLTESQVDDYIANNGYTKGVGIANTIASWASVDSLTNITINSTLSISSGELSVDTTIISTKYYASTQKNDTTGLSNRISTDSIRIETNKLRIDTLFTELALKQNSYIEGAESLTPAGGNTAVAVGLAVAATGTATAPTYVTTSKFTSTKRLEYLVAAASPTAIAGWRNTTAYYWRGNAAGGFYNRFKWGVATGAATATNRSFTGLINSVAAPTDVQPSTLLNIIGFGWDSADGNIQFMSNDGTGAATKINLGASFPVPTTDRTDMYDMRISASANSTSVDYYIKNLVTNIIAVGNTSTDLPANNIFLAPRQWISAGGTASVIGLSLFGYDGKRPL